MQICDRSSSLDLMDCCARCGHRTMLFRANIIWTIDLNTEIRRRCVGRPVAFLSLETQFNSQPWTLDAIKAEWETKPRQGQARSKSRRGNGVRKVWKRTRPRSFQTHPREMTLQSERNQLVYTNSSYGYAQTRSQQARCSEIGFFYQQCDIEIV